MEEGDLVPQPRSGHSTVLFGSKMYIFGGILEVTQELNDLVVFDLTTQKFVSIKNNDGATKPPQLDNQTSSNPSKQQEEVSSPLRATKQATQSPTRRK